MAFQHGVALPASLADLGDLTRAVLDARSQHNSYPSLVARNSSSSSNSTDSNTVTLFMDSVSEEFYYAGSIVSACKDQTVYALQCTEGPATITLGLTEGDSQCGSDAPAITLTEGPSTYIVNSVITTSTLGYEAIISVGEHCDLADSTAECTGEYSVSLGGTTSTSSVVTAYSGSEYLKFTVPITSGAEKTASATGACAVASSTTAPSAASGLSAKSMAMWALAGVVGVSGLLAM